MMKTKDESLEAYFISLGKLEIYARAYWAYLKGKGERPEPPKDVGVSDKEVQEVRFRLGLHL
jgi:hypothetical protein